MSKKLLKSSEKMYAKSEHLIFVKSQQNIAWAHEIWGSALATSIKIYAKIDEKSHVFWNIDFGWIFSGFWEGFGRPKSTIFEFFSLFFRSHFWSTLGNNKKSTQEPNKTEVALPILRRKNNEKNSENQGFWPPKTLPKSFPNRCLKKHANFESFRTIFKKISFLETLKISISPKENHYFQGFC